MKAKSIITNKTLNELSIQTKNIIDNMYNLCHYYYVYAIIALINIDLSNENKFIQIYDKVLSK